MERIESERLYLRPFGHGDAEAVWAYRSLAEVARYQYWEPYTPEDARSFIERYARAGAGRGSDVDGAGGGAESYRHGDRGLCVLSGRRSGRDRLQYFPGLSTPGLAREALPDARRLLCRGV